MRHLIVFSTDHPNLIRHERNGAIEIPDRLTNHVQILLAGGVGNQLLVKQVERRKEMIDSRAHVRPNFITG
jgi:hypothetical protein